MKKGLKRFVVIGLSLLMLTGVLTGCTPELQNAQEGLNDAALDEISVSEVVKMETNDIFTKYVFAGADVIQRDGKYMLDVSGFATTDKNKHAYTNMEYEVDANYFNQIDSKNATEVLNAITKVIQDYEMQSFDYAPMTSLTKFNSAMNETFESPLQSYNLSSGLTYAIDDITFNEEQGYVSFDTRQNTNYSDTKVEMVYTIIGVDSNGHPKMGYRAQSKTYYEKFNEEHTIYIKASPEEIAQMKQDKSLIFDKFVTLVKEEKKTEYTVKAGNIQQEKAFDDASEYSMSRDIERGK